MAKTKEVEHGGGSAVGLGDDFVNFLSSFINGSGGGGGANPTPMGQVAGSNPVGTTMNIGDNIRNILGGGTDFGNMGQSLTSIIQGQQKNDIGDLRERYTASGGGSSVGTPAATAEASYRAQAAPQAAVQLGQLQLQTIAPLLGIISNFASKGVSQRQNELLVEPNGWGQLASALAGMGAGAGSILSGVNAGKTRFN